MNIVTGEFVENTGADSSNNVNSSQTYLEQDKETYFRTNTKATSYIRLQRKHNRSIWNIQQNKRKYKTASIQCEKRKTISTFKFTRYENWKQHNR